MAVYRSWDQEQILKPDDCTRDSSNLNHQITTSLKPVNRKLSNHPAISQRRTPETKRLDSNSLHDLSNEVTSELPSITFKKRPAALDDREVFLAYPRNSEERGELARYSNGPDPEGPSPKRKKVAPKRAESKDVLSTTFTQAWKRNGRGDYDQQGEQADSQLSTRPNSGKSAKSTISSLPSKVNPHVRGLFQDIAVTKPSAAKWKGENLFSPPGPAIPYQGFTTTEAKLKSASVSLSSTTLQKLAAFRYTPSAECIISLNPLELEGSPSETELLVSRSPTSSYDLVSRSQLTYNSGNASHGHYQQPVGSPVYADPVPRDKLTVNEIVTTTHQIVLQKTPSSPQIQQSEFDDDFPMHEEDEKEMLRLFNPCLNVNESFIPLANTQDVFIDNQESDQYGDYLLFPPRMSLENLINDQDTHKLSKSQTPKLHMNSSLSRAPEEEDWICMRANETLNGEEQMIYEPFSEPRPIIIPPKHTKIVPSSPVRRAQTSAAQPITASAVSTIDDSHEYEPLLPFARPVFAPLIMDRSLVNGLSTRTFLRTCFRIGEMIQAGVKCNALGLDAIIELFARVNFSSRESGTIKQHFQFLDLWHDRAPYPNGILRSFNTTSLAESESKVFLTGGKKMSRVLGKWKRDGKRGTSWMLEIINIRETDWEEIKWTRRIISGDDLAKKEREAQLWKH